MDNSYSSPYICYCSKEKHTIGICINWNEGVITGYDCSYPNCSKDCQLLKEQPIGFKVIYPKQQI